MSTETDAVAEAMAGELKLMAPDVRASRSLAGRLLDPDFTEVGASGRRWDRQAMLDALAGMQGGSEDGPRHEPVDMVGTALAPGMVHLTYETTIDGQRARRSSIWRKLDAMSRRLRPSGVDPDGRSCA
ncbi:DUF4440 domain-containing protein [Streptomyces sp. NPDC048257]|uniref:nuclear transport factor 2 family protein n=1 Tax=Streptomyces sp. NPDC048257 TaxID=3365526 RepID=UPI00371C2A76